MVRDTVDEETVKLGYEWGKRVIFQRRVQQGYLIIRHHPLLQ